MYLTEIAPVNYRGLLGSVNQLMVTVAILTANILGLDSLLGTNTLWPFLLGTVSIKNEYYKVINSCFSFYNCSRCLAVVCVAMLSRIA